MLYYFYREDEKEKIIFQVKSGKVKSGDIRDLLGVMALEKAEIGIFITSLGKGGLFSTRNSENRNSRYSSITGE